MRTIGHKSTLAVGIVLPQNVEQELTNVIVELVMHLGFQQKWPVDAIIYYKDFGTGLDNDNNSTSRVYQRKDSCLYSSSNTGIFHLADDSF